ncbi:MAG TPA: hydroxymethylbilane synthase, partial [Chloroflexota bacterium]|nr:hydroxymethylbilane synthase [Chloroflexota bacterium]
SYNGLLPCHLEASIRRLIIGTRGSTLAQHQTRRIVKLLSEVAPGQQFDIHVVRTLGDRVQSIPLHEFPSTGIFVQDIGAQLLAGKVDLAVHSLKDVPPGETDRLLLASFPERSDPRDVIVARDGSRFAELPPAARVGTSSTRRRAQLGAARPDLTYCDDLRGNVDTRLNKLREGRYDAIVLAAAGLERLGRSSEISDYLSPEICLPDAGQGTLVVQTRADDAEVIDLVTRIDDPKVRATALAERAVLEAFGGGCKVPVAAYARVEAELVKLQGLVATPDGTKIVRAALRGSVNQPIELGRRLWSLLVHQGAAELLLASPGG